MQTTAQEQAGALAATMDPRHAPGGTIAAGMEAIRQAVALTQAAVIHYRTDIRHSENEARAVIEANGGAAPFLMIGRECGHELAIIPGPWSAYWPAPGEIVPHLFTTGTRWNRIGRPLAIADTYTSADHDKPGTVYVVSNHAGTIVRKVSAQEAAAFVRHHVETVRGAWRHDNKRKGRSAGY